MRGLCCGVEKWRKWPARPRAFRKRPRVRGARGGQHGVAYPAARQAGAAREAVPPLTERAECRARASASLRLRRAAHCVSRHRGSRALAGDDRIPHRNASRFEAHRDARDTVAPSAAHPARPRAAARSDCADVRIVLACREDASLGKLPRISTRAGAATGGRPRSRSAFKDCAATHTAAPQSQGDAGKHRETEPVIGKKARKQRSRSRVRMSHRW